MSSHIFFRAAAELSFCAAICVLRILARKTKIKKSNTVSLVYWLSVGRTAGIGNTSCSSARGHGDRWGDGSVAPHLEPGENPADTGEQEHSTERSRPCCCEAPSSCPACHFITLTILTVPAPLNLEPP